MEVSIDTDQGREHLEGCKVWLLRMGKRNLFDESGNDLTRLPSKLDLMLQRQGILWLIEGPLMHSSICNPLL